VADVRDLLRRTADLAADFLESIDERPVFPRVSVEELRDLLGGPLPAEPMDPELVIEQLAAEADPGIVAIPSGRYFGFVIGGGLPAALAADWLASAWDQNAGLYIGGPSAAVVEEVVREWVCDLLGLPGESSIGFVTGTQMGSVTALAAARFRVLERAGWDVSRDGLTGGPRVHVLVGEKRHVTIDRALRLLGLGAPDVVPADSEGRMETAPLRDALRAADGPTIVCAQAGEVNTGAFDPLEAIADAVEEHGAWLHVDGAFGLWAAASPQLRHLVRGANRAHSWITDTHKWLNGCDDGERVVPDAGRYGGPRRGGLGTGVLPAGTRLFRLRGTPLAWPGGRRGARGTNMCVRPPVRGGDRRATGRRAAQRGRAQPGPVPLRLGRTHG
jgi:hypothetical protein